MSNTLQYSIERRKSALLAVSFNVLSIASLLLAIAIAMLWMWSYSPSIVATDHPLYGPNKYPPPYSVQYPAVVEGFEYVVPIHGMFQFWFYEPWMGAPNQRMGWARDGELPMAVPMTLFLALPSWWFKQKKGWRFAPAISIAIAIFNGVLLLWVASTLL